MKKRFSNIELLKVLSLLLITTQHVLTSSNIDFGVASSDLGLIIYNCLRYIGYLGNTIFVICSCYFLIESNNSNKTKIINIISDVFAISIIWLIPFIFLDINLSSKDYIREFFPIIFSTNWFIGCYLILYLVHPLLNKIIVSLNQKELLRINIFSFLIYFIIQFFVKDILFFNELIFFVLLYFITAYLKKYLNNFCNSKRINMILLFISLFLYFVITIITNYLGLKISFFYDKVLYWNHNMGNPFTLLIGISLFNLFNIKPFYNSTINSLSNLSLLYYVIHENILFRSYIRPLIYMDLLSVINNDFCTIIILVFSTFIFGSICSYIYKYLFQKIVHKFAYIIFDIAKKKYIVIEEKILKI